MPNRYSLRLRPIFDDNEPTWGQSAQHGIAFGLDRLLQKQESDREFQNQVSAQGGTVDPQSSAMDKIRGLFHRGNVMGPLPRTGPTIQTGASEGVDPMQGGFLPQQQQMRQTGAMDDRGGTTFGGSPRGNGFQLPPGVTPYNPDPRAAIGRSGGISSAINNSIGDTYQQIGPNGQVAHLPRRQLPPTRGELAAAVAKARAGDPTDLYALDPSLIQHDTSLFPKDKSEYEAYTGDFDKLTKGGMAPDAAAKLLRQKYGKSEPVDPAEWDRRQGVTFDNQERLTNLRESGAEKRTLMREEAVSGREAARTHGELTQAQATTRGKAMLDEANKAIENLTGTGGEVQDQAAYTNARQMRDQGLKLLGLPAAGVESASPGLTARRANATPESRALRQNVLAQEFKRRAPGITQAKLKQAVKSAMVDEGWYSR